MTNKRLKMIVKARKLNNNGLTFSIFEKLSLYISIVYFPLNTLP